MRGFFRPSRPAILAASVLLVYALVGFFLIPYLVKAYAIPAVAEKINRPVLVKDVELNPFLLSFRMTELEIRESDQSPLLGFGEFFVDFEAISLFRLAYVFDTIRFSIPYVSARVYKDGRMNLAELIPKDASSPPPESEEPSGIPAVQIAHFEIARGIVEFRDESKPKPFTVDIVPLNIVLNNFHTTPGGDNTYAFTAEIGRGEILDWKGTVNLEPLRSEGSLSLSGIKIPTIFQYVQHQFNFNLPAGTIQANGRYRFDESASPADLQVSDAALHLANIQVTEKGVSDPVITIPTVDVEGIQFDLRKRSVAISSVAVADATDLAWRNADGTLNFQHLFSPVRSDSPPEQAASAEPEPTSAQEADDAPWSLTIAEATVRNHTIHFEDRSLATTMRADVTSMSAKTHDFAFPITKPIPLTVEHNLNETGTVSVDGQIIVKPFQLDMAVALKNIAIQPFQPYFEKVANIAVDSGTVDLDGDVHLAMDHGKNPLMTFHGNTGVAALSIAERERGLPVASWKKFHIKSLDLALDPTAVTIEEVTLDQPVFHLGLLPDGQLNLKKLLPQPDDAAGSPAPEAVPEGGKKSSSPSIAIKTVKFLKGTATFKDESIAPTVKTGLYDFTGTVKGLSSKQLAKADVDLSGKVDKSALLKIAGKINPLTEDAFTDLAVTLGGMDLTVESPYSGKYAGYKLSKGRLSLDLTYKVSKKQLEAENKVLVDQLTFGEKTESPDATSLPVPLVIALLKDRKGRIEIDLPIRGDLNDPDFKYGKAVISTLVNILTKIVASPFALMGKLIPGGASEEELQFVEFQPGLTQIEGAEINKLDAITKALVERPALRLDIAGTADPELDRAAIAKRKLREELLAMRQRERGQGAANGEPLSPEDEARLVGEWYEKQRGKLEKGLPSQPPGAKPPKPPTVEEMKARLLETIAVDENDLRALARKRAEQVRDHLLTVNKLGAERIFLLDVDPNSTGHDKVRSKLAIDVVS